MKNTIYVILFFLLFLNLTTKAQVQIGTSDHDYNRNQIELCPLLEIWIIQYGRFISPNNQIVFGVQYLNSEILKLGYYPGTEQNIAFSLGYRRHLFSRFNIDFQLYGGYIWIYEKNEKTHYNGFSLNAISRFGYQFEFDIKKVPLTLNVQWFLGSALINPRPKSFTNIDGTGGLIYFSPIPVLLLGYKF